MPSSLGHLCQRRLGPVLVALVALLIVVSSDRTRAQSSAVQTVKVRSMPYLSYAVLHLAQQDGLFAQQGLKVDLIDMDASAPVIPALARGDLDVLPAVMSPALFNAIARGADIRMVASESELIQGGCTTTAIVANHAIASSGRLQRPDGWKNLRVAASRAPFSGFLLDKLLKPIGTSEDQLQHVDVPDQIEAETIRAGRADVGIMSEPWLTRALIAKDVTLWKPLQDVAPGFQYTVVLYGPTLLKAHRDVGQRFMTAFLEATRRFDLGKTPRNIEIVAAATGLDRELLSRACWPAVRANAEVNTAGALEFQTWARERGLVDRVLPLADFHDNSFSASARSAAGSPR
jgi:NitT/TauT family transport system substrate-binding protein